MTNDSHSQKAVGRRAFRLMVPDSGMLHQRANREGVVLGASSKRTESRAGGFRKASTHPMRLTRRAFGNLLREAVESPFGALLEPVTDKMAEALHHVADNCPHLEPKCADLRRSIIAFAGKWTGEAGEGRSAVLTKRERAPLGLLLSENHAAVRFCSSRVELLTRRGDATIGNKSRRRSIGLEVSRLRSRGRL